MLEWKDEYAIGIDIIDEQHKRLFEIGNDAYRLLKDDFCTDHYDGVIQIIKDLREYTKFHFKTEEEYMLKIGYNKYFSQKVAHDDFIQKIYEIDLELVDENPKKFVEDLLAFTFDWILEHILVQDIQIAAK